LCCEAGDHAALLQGRVAVGYSLDCFSPAPDSPQSSQKPDFFPSSSGHVAFSGSPPSNAQLRV